MRITILACLAAFLPLCSQAADIIRPFDAKLGLWETTSEIGGMPAMPSMPQIPEEALSKMPPQQRAQMEAMMKSGAMGGRPMTTKACLTRESLDRGLAFGQSDKSCVYNVVSSSPSKQVIHVECTQDKTKTVGDLTVERVDAEHAKGSMVMKASGEGSRQTEMKMSFSTKWVSADCGDVKPIIAK